ncbi:hypothetical protein M0802_007765 [Mischocyttarus mexicanus]|nr:hypothetical protein M0802_007765 [Mischocyttarus mexicanus]
MGDENGGSGGNGAGAGAGRGGGDGGGVGKPKLDMKSKDTCSGASGNYDRGINGIIGQSQFLLVLSLTLGTVYLTRTRMTLGFSDTYEGARHYETRGLV